MRKKALALMAVLMGTGVALAQGPGGPAGGPQGPRPGRGAGLGPERVKQELGLTDEQEAQLRKLHSEQRKAQIHRRADLQVARMDLHELLGSKSVDEKAVAAKMREINDLTAAGLKAHVDAQLSLRKVLTPEQVDKMKQLHQRRPRQLHRRPGRLQRGEGPEPPDEEMGPPADDDEALTGEEAQ